MSSFTADTFVALGEYARHQGIQYSVLSGYDPCSDTFGRDLDIHVPNPRDCQLLLREFWRVLGSAAAPWKFCPDPIWGKRCIGISAMLEYAELHTFSAVRVGPMLVSSIFPPETIRAKNGLLFDPLYICCKKVLTKYNRDILAGNPLWQHTAPPSFLREYTEQIDGRTWPGFTDAMLGEDTRDRLRVRRRFLLRFLVSGFSHPIESATRSVHGIWKRKVGWLQHPCVPFFSVKPESADIDAPALEQKLNHALGHIFPEIVVARQPVSWKKIRKLQARQRLLLILDDPHFGRFLPGHISIEAPMLQDIPQLTHRILDCTVAFNTRFSDMINHSF